MAERDGLHGLLEQTKAERCALCHSDHHGGDFAIVNERSFAHAGIADVQAFDHGLLDFPMEGKHLELDCSECHTYSEAPILPKGEKRFRGLDQDCSTCHDDAHDGAMTIGCIRCHGQESFGFDGLDAFEHEFFVPLIGGHADLSCDQCHDTGRHTLDAIGRMGRPAAARECASCHESPHERAFLQGVAELAGKSEAASCGACHKAQHTSFRDERLELAKSQHALSGFRLDPPHEAVACDDCHDPGLPFEARYPGRGQNQCASCHEDPHGGQFDALPFAVAGCIACHDRESFTPHTYTVEDHDQSAMPLTGQHRDAECELCHLIEEEGAPRTFVGTSTSCGDCHEDAHMGYFDQRAATIAELSAPECGSCHETETFTQVEDGRFDHGFWTAFPIDGAHAQEDCQSCHQDAHEPDRFGRTFGRVARHDGAFQGCATCHEDPHEGGFDGPGFPAQVEGRRDCARCHETSSFRAAADTFDHELWTGFALEDAHAAADCTACHTPLRRPDARGRTWGEARGKRCEDCHDDPHVGQFERNNGRTNCVRCHKSGKSFTELAFHHNWHSRFLLDEAHETLSSAASCHGPVQTEAWVEASPLPAALGMECVDCHGVHEDQIAAQAEEEGWVMGMAMARTMAMTCDHCTDAAGPG